MATKLAPNSVSGRVVNTSIRSWPFGAVPGTISKRTSRQALRTADPVGLHQPDLLRPANKTSQRLEQVLRIVGDLEHPFRLLALLDHGAGAPTAPVDHLLVGEHRPVDRVPIDLVRLAVDQAGLAHGEKQPLLLVVIVEVASGEFTPPVESQADGFELAPHRVDVVVGPFRRMQPRSIAAFSAGRPKASQPIGWSTL